jgi:hypothetical protein
MNFKIVEAEDIPVISKFLLTQNFRTCDFSIGGMFMWRNYFVTSYLIHEDCLFFKIKYFNNLTCFTFPIGFNSNDKALEILEHYIREEKFALFNLCTVPEEALSVLKKKYDSRISAIPLRDWFDYLYNIEDLAELKGKKYHSQRNHINKFQKLYPNYSFNRITTENIVKIQQFLHNKQSSLMKAENELALQEYEKTKEMMLYFTKFGLIGGFIELNGEVIAFTVGEVINDTLFIHIEKALIEYEGSYPMIAHQFIKQFDTSIIHFVNREEDVGDDGLRKSKLSYYPVQLLSKYLVTIKL